MTHWVYLVLAILLEVAGTTSMKLSDGFSKPIPSILIFVFYAGAFVFLTLALKKLDIGIAYATWAGVGTAIIAAIGVLFFKDTINAVKLISLVLIVAGVIGLNMSGMKH